MASLPELEDALKNADAAGDAAGAQILADEIVKMRSTPQGVTGEGMAKALGTGVAQGTIALPGMFGDAAQMNSDILSGGAEYLGAPQWAQDAAGFAGKAMMGPLGFGPTSDQLTKSVETVTGPMRKAQNVPEEYAQTTGNFIPSMLLGGGKAVQKVGTGLLSALTSETAGQVARNTIPEAEPYARLGGALLGGRTRAAKSEAPTAADWRDKKNALYSAAESGIGKLKMTRTHVDRLAQGFNEVGKDSNKGGVLASITDDLYKGTNTTISKFNKITGDVQAGKVPPPTFGELEKMRQDLNAAVSQNILPTGKLTADGTMSARLVDKIDDMLVDSPFKEARATYRTMIKAEKMERAFHMAELNAGSNYTQAGMEKAIQGQFKKLATDKNFTKLFTKEEQAAIEGVVNIGGVHKAVKMFGGLAPKGALSTMFNIGMVTQSPEIGIPLGVAAGAAKFGSTARIMNKANRADEMVRSGGKPMSPRGLLSGNNIRRLGLLGTASQTGN